MFLCVISMDSHIWKKLFGYVLVIKASKRIVCNIQKVTWSFVCHKDIYRKHLLNVHFLGTRVNVQYRVHCKWRKILAVRNYVRHLQTACLTGLGGESNMICFSFFFKIYL